MYYRHSGQRPAPPAGLSVAEANRRELKALATGDTPPGLIGYFGDEPVGWISLGPREDYAKLRRSPIMKAVDDQPVWSIVCFVVPGEHRGRGVARGLLKGAIAFAKSRNVKMLEAYPVDREQRSRDDAMFFGAKSMYDAFQFKEVARRKPERPVLS